jgi:hypothetical protein
MVCCCFVLIVGLGCYGLDLACLDELCVIEMVREVQEVDCGTVLLLLLLPKAVAEAVPNLWSMVVLNVRFRAHLHEEVSWLLSTELEDRYTADTRIHEVSEVHWSITERLTVEIEDRALYSIRTQALA